jgi:hypothetical protein
MSLRAGGRNPISANEVKEAFVGALRSDIRNYIRYNDTDASSLRIPIRFCLAPIRVGC